MTTVHGGSDAPQESSGVPRRRQPSEGRPSMAMTMTRPVETLTSDVLDVPSLREFLLLGGVFGSMSVAGALFETMVNACSESPGHRRHSAEMHRKGALGDPPISRSADVLSALTRTRLEW